MTFTYDEQYQIVQIMRILDGAAVTVASGLSRISGVIALEECEGLWLDGHGGILGREIS